MDNEQIQLIFQLLLVVIFGGLIGFEREWKRKEAGLQTYTLVTLGACVFTIISSQLFNFFGDKTGLGFDPSRIILAVATGIGFIGAGAIFRRENHTEGITTAAGLWAVAGIGVAVGAKLYFLALMATFFTLLVLIIYGELEKKFIGKR